MVVDKMSVTESASVAEHIMSDIYSMVNQLRNVLNCPKMRITMSYDALCILVRSKMFSYVETAPGYNLYIFGVPVTVDRTEVDKVWVSVGPEVEEIV